jgi:hypothetical protein
MKRIRQHHVADPETAIQHAVIGQTLQHMGAEAADGPFLDGDEDFVFARQLQDHVEIERLHETSVGDGCGQTEGFEFVGSLEAFAEPCTKGQQRHLRAFAHDPALADRQRHAEFGHFDAAAFAAWITQRARCVVERNLCCHHVDEVGFIRRCHDDEAGKATEIGVVERTGMSRTVLTDQTGAVDGEAHRQALDRDVMHDLIVAALQERRIDRAERLEAFGGKARGERHGVLLGDADIEGAFGGRPSQTDRRRCLRASPR